MKKWNKITDDIPGVMSISYIPFHIFHIEWHKKLILSCSNAVNIVNNTEGQMECFTYHCRCRSNVALSDSFW